MKKFFMDLLTEKDNQTFCAFKTIIFGGSLVFIGCAIAHVIINHTFDAQAFGIGIGALAGGGGVGVMTKDK